MLLNDILDKINEICPFALQEDWDNSGLQVGDPNADIQKVLVAFDFTEDVLAEAIEKDVDLVITHHPFFFKGIRQIDASTAKGRMICGLIGNDIALVSCHTNLDKVGYGVSAVLGKQLGLVECRPFIAEGDELGFGVIGKLAEPMVLSAFAQQVKTALDIPMIRVVGDRDKEIITVAAMGGAGSDFMAEAKAMGADVYVTADLKYHDGQFAAEMGLAMMDAGHFETESATMEPFAEKLSAAMADVEFIMARNVSSYWQIL
ncbi:MAG: Nif3-like dinuclear metal center hexameric protein [Firmicutes bacterium]|nr:Nif3-like dinuclear metal center hexameric protein [Bacillota bacterium]